MSTDAAGTTDGGPVVVVAIFTPADGAVDALRAALVAAIPAVHDEAGCELYAIHDAPDGEIWMVEKWTSEAELDAHGSGAAVSRLGELVEGLTDGPVRVVRMWPIPAGTAEQGQL